MIETPNTFAPQTIQSKPTQPPKKRPFLRALLALTGLILVGLVISFYHVTSLLTAPVDFPTNQVIVIEQGTDVRAVTEILEQKSVVQSAALLYYTLVLLHDPTDIKASAYMFDRPLSTPEVAKRLTEGDFDTDLIRFTHFEGERAELLAARAVEVLPNFDRARFLAAAIPLEGKLYPETYFIPATYTDEELLALLQATFEEKVHSLQTAIESSTLTLDEVITLASIIEREANTKESKQLVSSVLQNRLEIGMALQADASIEYILDKPLAELTPDDLEIDSPYNTYLYPGLPPTPIGNPGLDAIMAVLEPADTEYFYYITDDEGMFHYAETYNEHLQNIKRYLR